MDLDCSCPALTVLAQYDLENKEVQMNLLM